MATTAERGAKDQCSDDASLVVRIGQALVDTFSLGSCLHYADPRVICREAEEIESDAAALAAAVLESARARSR